MYGTYKYYCCMFSIKESLLAKKVTGGLSGAALMRDLDHALGLIDAVVAEGELTPKQRELHDAAMNAAGCLAQIARRRPLTPSEQNRLLAALQQARMACNAAGLVDKKTEGAPKLDELAILIEELCVQSGLKAVVSRGGTDESEICYLVAGSLFLVLSHSGHFHACLSRICPILPLALVWLVCRSRPSGCLWTRHGDSSGCSAWRYPDHLATGA